MFTPIAHKFLVGFVSAAISALLVASAAFSADWPQSRVGPEASGFNAGESILQPSNLSQLALSWRTTISAAPLSSPVVAGGTVYVGSNDGNLYALNASTGAIAWRGAVGASSQTPAVAGGRVFVGSDDTNVYAFPTSCSTPCSPLWVRPTPGRISSAPVVSNGVVYLGAGNGAEGDLWALDAASGAVVWSSHLSGSPVGIAVENGVVYASDGNSLLAFPASCSTPCSSLWLGQSAGAPPAIGSGEVFSDAGYVNDRFNVFPANGSCSTPCAPLWTGHTNSGTRRAAAVANGTVFLSEGDGTLAAFPVQCSTLCIPSWTVPLGGFVSAPSVANGIVYVGTDTDVKTFAATDGTPLPHIATGTTTFSPSIANGVVYVSTFSFSAGGKVSAYALNATDTQPPELHLPGDITVMAGDSSGAVVSYEVSAEDAIDPNPTLSCTPPSGSIFAIGTTTVTCVATDASGNQANGSFSVTVLAPWDMTLTLATKDTVNPKTGVVTVTGTVNCNRDGNLSIYGTLRQVVATRATLNGNFFISVNCTAPSTLWTAQVTADSGKFLPGKASLNTSAFGCELTCDSAEASQTVTLRAQ